MIHWHRFVSVLSGTLLLALPSAFAQSSSTGAIQGTVKDLIVGRNLENAQISAVGTNMTTSTDAGGRYYLSGVPAGNVTIRAFYTGMQPQEREISVVGGGLANANFDLSAAKQTSNEKDVLKLDQFVVASTRETNAESIAVNEQRFASNMKNVVAVDAYGPQANHNAGEFLKWLPGVGVEYFANNITGVNVNGLGSINTEIEFGGVQSASAFTESTDRGFQMKATSIADIQRAEIRLMPLPEDSANSIGGTINLIPRSAFEYNKAITRYEAYVTSDGERLTLADRDGPKDRKMQYWRPNLEIQFTDPITKDFGIVFSASHDQKIVRTHWSQPGWDFGTATANTAAAITEPDQATAVAIYNADVAAKVAPPVYTRYTNPANVQQLLHDAPILDTTDEVALRADWRPTPELTVSNDARWTYYTNQTSDDIRYRWKTGGAIYANANTTLGLPGKGSSYFDTPLWRDQYEPTITDTVTARWRHNDWKGSFVTSYSYSSHQFADTKDGFFNSSTQTGNNPLTNKALFSNIGIGTGTANPTPVTVNFLNQSAAMPQTIQMFDASGNAVDWSDTKNLYIGGFRSKPSKAYDTFIPLRISLERDFDIGSNPAFVKGGFDFSDQFYNKQRYDQLNWSFVGPDHIAGTADDTASQIAAVSLEPHRDDVYNAPPIQHISMSRAYALYQAHPDWFVYQDVASYAMSAQQPFEWEERYYAPYLEGQIQLFHNRLNLIGGVRYERDDAEGRGFLLNPNGAFQKYADGTTPKNTADILNPDGTPQLYSNGQVKRTGDVINSATGLPTTRAAGTYVYLPGVTAGSMQEAQLTYIRKGAHGAGSNRGFFPSLHTTYHITDNLALRAAWAKVQAKNRLDRSVIPNTSISDTPDTSLGVSNLGVVTVRNPALKPWKANLFQVDLEYYSKSGGVFQIGVYRREISDFQENLRTYIDSPSTAATFGLGGEAVGYVASTWLNAGSVHIDGAQASASQRLDGLLPAGLAGFAIKANFTYNNYIGDANLVGSDFSSLYRDRESCYLSYSHRRFNMNVGFIRTGPIWQKVSNASGGIPGYTQYIPMNEWDAQIGYQIRPWLRVYIAGNDLTNEQKTRNYYLQGAPTYSQLQIENNLGRTYSIGFNGTF